MSYKSGFFDAVDLGEGVYDRVYSAADFAEYFSRFVGNESGLTYCVTAWGV